MLVNPGNSSAARTFIVLAAGKLNRVRLGEYMRGCVMGNAAVSAGARGPIAVRISALSQLFNSLDPFPFQERDLDKNAEEFIVGWARELPGDQPLEIVLYLPAGEAQKPDAQDVGEALRTYFRYRAEVTERELHQLFRTGRLSLAIGLAVLAVGLLATQFITGRLGESSIARYFQEGLIIMSWVANWRPIEIFLYDWWPLRRTRDLHRRLSEARVEIRTY
jgi:hypothetical protein